MSANVYGSFCFMNETHTSITNLMLRNIIKQNEKACRSSAHHSHLILGARAPELNGCIAAKRICLSIKSITLKSFVWSISARICWCNKLNKTLHVAETQHSTLERNECEPLFAIRWTHCQCINKKNTIFICLITFYRWIYIYIYDVLDPHTPHIVFMLYEKWWCKYGINVYMLHFTDLWVV